MPGRGTQTQMPRAALPRTGENADAYILWTAFGVASLFVAVQIGFATTFTPVMLGWFEKAGLELPALLALAQSLGPVGIVITLSVVDLAIFVACAWAARRYWIGMLFLPPAIYLAITFALFIGLVGGSAAVGLAR